MKKQGVRSSFIVQELESFVQRIKVAQVLGFLSSSLH